MSSRDQILRALRTRRAEEAALPTLEGPWIEYSDPYQQFATMLEAVGGRPVRVPTRNDIANTLAGISSFAEAKRVASLVPDVPGNVNLAEIADPHDLETLDWVIMPGEFGVAENGAVWLTDQRIAHRVSLFITQHLAIVLPADQIVPNMHAAYERVTLGQSSLGIFISGPSKTADIEQSLVIGAHGPRSLTVICVEEFPSTPNAFH